MPADGVFVCDTHPLVWLLTDSPRLSRRARAILNSADNGDINVYIPVIVLGELLSTASRGKLEWEHLFEVLLRIEGGQGFRSVDVDMSTFSEMMRVEMLPPDVHPNLELHDLSILATALLLDASIITKDRKLVNQQICPTVW